MRRVFSGVMVIGVVLLTMSIVSAQERGAGQGDARGRGAGAAGGGGGQGAGRGPAAPTNLQVLPKDMAGPQVVQIMQAFAAALGVQCAYCHVTAAGPGTMNDFASDVKPPKKTARVMMLMARDVNAKLGMELGRPAAEVTQVQCVTCHRGLPVPKQLVDIVADTATKQNVAAAIAQYRDLRKQFYGSASYDFSDYTLFTAAQRAIAAMKPDEALSYLQVNVELNPNSARSYQQMSVAYQRKMDTPNAITMLEKAVELDPMNMGFRNQLNQLKNPSPAAPPAQ